MVIYAGSSPATKFDIVAKLYPNVSFHLFDGKFKRQDFAVYRKLEESEEIPNVHIHAYKFTEELAEKYSTIPNIFFWSDYRRFTPERDKDILDPRIAEDMQTQKRWVELMKPKAWMLRFRIPYPDRPGPKTTTYLKGDEMFVAPFHFRMSPETRLIGSSVEETVYDHLEHEEKMCYFNAVVRSNEWQMNCAREEADHFEDPASFLKQLFD